MATPAFTIPDPISARDLSDAGLLEIGAGATVSPYARFVPRDRLGTLRTIVIGARCTVGANTTLHGGVRLNEGVLVEDNVILGQPEFGYAQRHYRPGAGTTTDIDAGVVIRAGAILYAGVELGELTTIGHHTLLRTGVQVGSDCQLAHNLTVERVARIGHNVRMSPGSHITSGSTIGDHAFLGAGIRTIDSMAMIWRDPEHQDELRPPHFGRAVKVGTGSTILAGVLIGDGALIGAGSVVTRDIPPNAVAYGVPARVRSEKPEPLEIAS